MPERRIVGRRALAFALTAFLLVTAAVVAVSTSGSDASDRFVTRSGSSLRVGDAEFRFVGFNLYDAAASDIYSCLPATRLDDGALDDAMRAVHDSGGSVVRFWAYQTYTAGGTDYSGVDRVIAAARNHDLRVLPVLEDGPGNCSTGEGRVRLADAENGTWYSEGYRLPYGSAVLSYRDYVARIASHYRDDPTILGWSLMNEAETTQRDYAGRSQLVDFARDVSNVVHKADPNHLVTLGTQGNGASGASGADFAAIYSLPGMDFTEVHDWGFYGGDDQPMPGDGDDGSLPSVDECRATNAQIACAFTIARELDKPIVVGEAGMRARSADTRVRRAGLFRPKIAAAFDAGASGYLIWQLSRANTDGYGVRIGSGDPLYKVLIDAAAKFGRPR